MKVLIVNTHDIKGGAARAAYRLHTSLLDQNVNSQMLVQSKDSDSYTVMGPESKFDKLLSSLKPTIDAIPSKFYKNKTATSFSTSWVMSSKLLNKINALNPDVVHLHWVNNGLLRIEDIAKIKAPIIWTLHDMWPFTGGCHYDEHCGAFEKGCGNCPVLGSENKKDLSYRVFERKRKTYNKIVNLTIVGVSKWLADCALSSTLFKPFKVVNLPNSIDTLKFKPTNQTLSRELWNLPKNKKLILFGAMGSISDPRKGFDELSDAFKNIKKNDVEFVVFGASTPVEPPDLGCKTHYIGSLSDDISLITLYSAVDLMVVPSRQEAFGQTASESMACGTPVVTFCHTGLVDIVDHKKNGYLAKPFDTVDLANGIEWVLGNDKYDELCSNARDKVIREFDSRIVADKYIELYRDVSS